MQVGCVARRASALNDSMVAELLCCHSCPFKQAHKCISVQDVQQQEQLASTVDVCDTSNNSAEQAGMSGSSEECSTLSLRLDTHAQALTSTETALDQVHLSQLYIADMTLFHACNDMDPYSVDACLSLLSVCATVYCLLACYMASHYIHSLVCSVSFG